MGFLDKETLCWSCKRPGTGSCSWDKSCAKVPVDGWTADAVLYRDGTGIYSITYNVIDCPLYKPDEYYIQRIQRAYLDTENGKREKRRKYIEEIENLLRYGWTDKGIASRFGISLTSAAGYRHRWRKKQRQ